ncbi:ABC transporter permease [Lacihabitans soyangensis]|uniref:ABC transporter permease n=1 Tax=Lacihabitans soyangensis TaxID=869394 RepID=A0AAE3KXI7_9BACT|nr:FtsX-like permease family protein [Lacihabitans soyangensis]MCP9765070.1 ABC transporter permease [Lacihabitans soyangensis]
MNIALYLAKKIQHTKNQTFSSIIVKVGIASIAIAVSVLILSFFILLGFKNTIKKKLFSQTSHIQVNKITLNRSFEEATMANNLVFFKNTKNLPEVKSVNKVAMKSVILKSEEEISGVVLKGIDEKYDWSEFEQNIVEGRKLKARGENEIIISRKIANELQLKLNQDLLVYFIQNPPRARKLKIVGIYDTNVEELDQVYVLTNLSIIQKINNWQNGEFGHYEIFIKDINQMDAVKSKLLNIFPQEYEVLKVPEIIPQFFDWFSLLDRNIVMVIGLIIIVAAFNMISVLLIMIMERTPMIGLLKAIGTQNYQIRNIFLLNSSKIILWGLLWGNIIGLGLSFLQAKYKLIKLDPTNYYMNFVPIEWNWLVVLIVNIGAFIVVLAISYLPSLIIRRISPVEALKYKD